MQSDWKAFLTHNGAEFEDEQLVHFGNPQRELRMVLGGNIITDLSHYSLLAIRGADRDSFLHSQFVNDVQALDESSSHLNGYCNPKGRMIANFRVFKRDGTTYLRLPKELTETLVKRLNMYKLRSKVEIEDVSDAFVRIGLSGKTADQKLASVLDDVPAAVDEALYTNNLTVIRVPGITPSYELYSDENSIQNIWTRLDVDSAPVGVEAWRMIEILAGMPHVLTDTSEEFVPQMLNYQAINGLSFKKGCYPGQEIVARMHYLGKLKKRMYLARIRSDDRPLPNQALVSNKKDSGSNTGNIINAEAHPDGGYIVLAVIQISDAESTDIHLENINGPLLELQDLPYTVELKQAD